LLLTSTQFYVDTTGRKNKHNKNGRLQQRDTFDYENGFSKFAAVSVNFKTVKMMYSSQSSKF